MPEYTNLLRLREEYSKKWVSFSHEDIILQPSAPILPYWEEAITSVEAVSAKWGQLKLFATTLYSLIRYWNWQDHGPPLILYAGAAPGWNIDILAEMFPSIKWILYDMTKKPASFVSKNITAFLGKEGEFTEKTAEQYSNLENVFFLSDVRRDIRGSSILKDMEAQARWMQIIRPKLSMLKFRLPYQVEGEPSSVNYFPGVNLIQAFTKKNSTETRLIVKGVPEMTTEYDKMRHEQQMFYHNVLTRYSQWYHDPVVGGLVDDGGNLDNHYDSVYLLFVLKDYIEFSGKKTTPLRLARDIMRKLNSRKDVPKNLKEIRQSALI